MKTIDELLSELRHLDVKLWADGVSGAPPSEARLRYKAPKETLTPALLQELKERKAEILAFLSKANAAASSNLPPILPVPKDGNLPLSFAQQRLWFLEQLEPGSSAYNMATAFRLTGLLNVTALEQSLGEIVRRHSILRTTFPDLDGQPVQVISLDLTLKLSVIDLGELPLDQREAEAQRLVTKEAAQPFNLVQGPLLSVLLLRLSNEEHLLLLTMHHIVSDGWSFNVFFRELADLYEAFLTGKPEPLPELPIQYADFAHWQRQWLQGEVLESQLDYWKQQLGGSLPVLSLPTDYPRPPVQTYRGAHQSLELPKNLTNALKSLSQHEGVTLFMTLLAAFQTLLYRYSGQEDIIVGSPIAGRNQAEIEGLIGFFINTLVLRTHLGGNPSFRELLGRVREVALGAYAHQDLPFEKLVEELQPERDLSRTPLFQVWFNMVNLADNRREMSGLGVEYLEMLEPPSKFDLTVYVTEKNQGIQLQLVYNADLFAPERMVEMLAQFQHLLQQIVKYPEERIARFSLVTAQAESLLPNPAQPLDCEWEGAVPKRLSHQARQKGEHLAVVDAQVAWSYAELEERANQLANYLRAHGIQRQDIVAIYAHRSAELVWALLGVLKAGAAFVILDPAYPASRLIDCLRVAEPRGWLQLEAAGELPAALEKFIETITCCCYLQLPQGETAEACSLLTGYSTNDPGVAVDPDDLAYVAFTSGSTGMPKGILGTHRPLSHFLSWHCQTFGLNQKDRFSMLSGLSHDPLLRDIFTPLWLGATLCIPEPKDQKTPGQLANWMQQQKVSITHLTPAIGQLLAETTSATKTQSGEITSLRYVFFSGDILTKHDVKRILKLAPTATCINFYGATETPQAMGYFIIPNPEVMVQDGVSASLKQSVPLGRGIQDAQLLLLNTTQQLAGIGEVGEIHVRTPYLAKGYMGDEALTQARFIINPFTKTNGDLLYKTGDNGHYLPDGNIEFLGRIDHQVKIRGFRIELGEVEAVLGQHPAVQNTVVMAREDIPGDKQLVAYVVHNQEQAPTVSELRSFLKAKLPEYMVPSAFVMLDALPLTPNGKVDRRALPAPDQERPALSGGFVAPRDPLEHQLTQIWEELLDIQPIGIKDNFFELGGHSLLAVRMMHRVEQVCGKKLPLSTLFTEATVEHLASVLLKQESRDLQSPLVEIQSGGSKRPFFFLHGDLSSGGFYCLNLARYLGKDQPFYALPPHGFDGAQMPPTIEAMAAAYLKTLRAFQPEGPYLLGGYCNGGLVAFEIARQLHAQGQKVDLLVLIDASAANARFKFLYSLVSCFGYFLSIRPDKQLSCFFLLRYYFIRFPHFSRLRIDEQLTIVLKKVRNGIKNVVSMFTLRSGGGQACTPEAPPDMRGNLIIRATNSYVPRLYPDRVTLFLSSEVPVERSDEPTLGWYKVAQEVDVHVVPGDHSTCITTHVQVLAEKLRTCLDKAQAAESE